MASGGRTRGTAWCVEFIPKVRLEVRSDRKVLFNDNAEAHTELPVMHHGQS